MTRVIALAVLLCSCGGPPQSKTGQAPKPAARAGNKTTYKPLTDAQVKRRCDEGDLDGCAEIATRVLNHDSDAVSEAEAYALFSRACDGGSVRGCTGVGTMYLLGKGRKRDVGKALRILREACEKNGSKACYQMGAILFSGRGVPRDEKRATRYFERSCDLGHYDACYNVGVVAAGSSTPDYTKAMTYATRACDHDVGPGCMHVARLHEKGLGRPASVAKARAVYRTSCAQGFGRACTQLGVDLSRDKAADLGIQFAEAATLLGRGCALGDEDGCRHIPLLEKLGAEAVGAMNKEAKALKKKCESSRKAGACFGAGYYVAAHAAGNLAKRDEANALYRKGCDLGSAAACAWLGWDLYSRKDDKTDGVAVADIFQRACQKDSALGCYYYGRVLLMGFGRPKSEQRAAEYIEEACWNGETVACGDLGILYLDGHGVETSARKAEFYLRRGCDAGATVSCLRLGDALIQGKLGGQPQAKQGALLVDKACTAGHGDACDLMGRLYNVGVGVKADVTKSAEYMKRACALGVAPACDSAKTK